jgi:hypothetical protein
MRRSASNDGVLGSVGRILPVRASLVAAVMGADLGRANERREKRQFNGLHPVRDYTKAKHPDNVILEIRRLKEQCQMMPSAIVIHMHQHGHPVTREDVVRILSYATRGYLVPDEGAASYLTKATQ